MVGNKKVVKASSVTTLIARNTRIQGTLEFSGVLEVEGLIVGDVIAPGDSKSVVRILNNGRVEGQLRVPQIVVNGEILGDVFAEEQLYLAEKAIIEGNVHYRVIEIEKGAQINGSILRMGAEEIDATQSNRPKEVQNEKTDLGAEPRLANS